MVKQAFFNYRRRCIEKCCLSSLVRCFYCIFYQWLNYWLNPLKSRVRNSLREGFRSTHHKWCSDFIYVSMILYMNIICVNFHQLGKEIFTTHKFVIIYVSSPFTLTSSKQSNQIYFPLVWKLIRRLGIKEGRQTYCVRNNLNVEWTFHLTAVPKIDSRHSTALLYIQLELCLPLKILSVYGVCCLHIGFLWI